MKEISETIFSIERINRMPLDTLLSMVNDCYNEIPINFSTIILLMEKIELKLANKEIPGLQSPTV